MDGKVPRQRVSILWGSRVLARMKRQVHSSETLDGVDWKMQKMGEMVSFAESISPAAGEEVERDSSAVCPPNTCQAQ